MNINVIYVQFLVKLFVFPEKLEKKKKELRYYFSKVLTKDEGIN